MVNSVHKNKNAYQYQEAIEIQFNSICEPLYNFGVELFGYIKIFPDGSYHLVNPTQNMELIRQYCFNINFQGIEVKKDIESSAIGKSHYAIYGLDYNFPNKTENPVLDLLCSFNFHPLFVIFKNRLEFVEIYSFSMNKNNHFSNNFYLKNISILDQFCVYFNDCAKDIIDSSDKKKRGYFDQKFNFHNQTDENFRKQQIKQSLQESYIKKRDLRQRESEFFSSQEEREGIAHLALSESVKEISGDLGITSRLIEKSLQAFKDFNKSQLNATGHGEGNILSSLSPRQKECLFLLTRGKTAKQIGQALGISYRTVETHIISLKSKMNCTTKNQLIEKVFDTNKISFMTTSN